MDVQWMYIEYSMCVRWTFNAYSMDIRRAFNVHSIFVPSLVGVFSVVVRHSFGRHWSFAWEPCRELMEELRRRWLTYCDIVGVLAEMLCYSGCPLLWVTQTREFANYLGS